MTLACSNVVLDGAVSSKVGGGGGAFGFRNGTSVHALVPGFLLQRRRLSFGLVIHLQTPNSRRKHSEGYATSIKANLDRSPQPSQTEKDALADDGVSASRDSMEDTVGADAKDMLSSWVGGVSSETGVKNGKDKEQKEIDDIEQQYLDTDKLDGNESEPKNGLDDARNRQTASEPVASSTEGSSGVVSPSAVLSSSTGRDWRVWAENGGRTAWPITETGETASSSEDFEVKQVFGWSESKCDKGSLLMDGSRANAETSSNSDAKAVDTNRKDQIAERLVSLEDLVMEKDNGRSAADYSRRADIFEKSNEVFTAKKKEADEQNKQKSNSCI